MSTKGVEKERGAGKDFGRGGEKKGEGKNTSIDLHSEEFEKKDMANCVFNGE